ncbi:SPOCS domain-containing protein [Clostridium uliginosum]|uniref:SipL SPOCS domain-containing protein n=1 Tax=Clostridium uliginosum TaxID=119641 RepID=A0A1I1L1J5_9CLOT|nr:SPOCS domain-containing protein [Clostridium uliginosum]SFC66402.1 protein of unknown function [Clostridium uliginosum]
MYCKCTKGNSYKVIGLCDPKNFNQKDKAAWTQITVPEILPLPECYPNIEDIDRIYVNVLIECTRVIETAVSDGANVEGTILTGRKLMVDGNICQTVVYTADTCEQSLHSINFKFPFCTSIVLDPKTDLEEDEFCVEVCVENVFAKALNPRTIFKSVTLFLLAKKATTICPSQNTISGAIANTTAKAADVTVELYDENGNVVDYKSYKIPAGATQAYSFVALCNGKYKVEFETSTAGLKMDPTMSSIIDVPPGAINVNSTVKTV